MAMDSVCATGRGVAEPGVLIDPRHHAIIHQEAGFAAHQPVAAFAGRQGRHHAGIKHVQEPARIGALDDDLAKGRGVQQSHVLPHVQDFAVNGLFMRLGPAREAIGAAPQADRFEIGIGRVVPALDRGAAQRLEDVAARLAGQRPQGNGRVGRAEGGGADLRDIFIQCLRKNSQTVDVA